MNPSRISLSHDLIFKGFSASMDVLWANRDSLSDYDRKLMNDLKDGFNLFGREMSVTRKQLNHIKTVAMDIESGRYA